jgi:hypothetical protein
MADKGFRVTVEDLENGGTDTRVIGPGDFALIPFGPCYVDSMVKHKNGTVQITLKQHAPQKPAETVNSDG